MGCWKNFNEYCDGGIGLGLASYKNIIEFHNGTIIASNNPKICNHFTFSKLKSD